MRTQIISYCINHRKLSFYIEEKFYTNSLAHRQRLTGPILDEINLWKETSLTYVWAIVATASLHVKQLIRLCLVRYRDKCETAML